MVILWRESVHETHRPMGLLASLSDCPMDGDKDCVLSASPRDTEFITGRTVHTSLFRMWTCSWVPESLDSWWKPNIIFLIPFLNTTTDKTIKSSWFSINHIRTIFFSSNPTTSPVSCPQRNVEKMMGISPRSSPNQTKVVVHNFFHN